MKKLERFVQFDYFDTPEDRILLHRVVCIKYGLTQDEVFSYIKIMRSDRSRWEKKQPIFELSGILLQILFSFILCVVFNFIAGIVAMRIGGSELTGAFVYFIVVSLLSIPCLFYIWSKELIIKVVGKYGIHKYKKRSQYDPVMEKYFDDCCWIYWSERFS